MATEREPAILAKRSAVESGELIEVEGTNGLILGDEVSAGILARRIREGETTVEELYAILTRHVED